MARGLTMISKVSTKVLDIARSGEPYFVWVEQRSSSCPGIWANARSLKLRAVTIVSRQSRGLPRVFKKYQIDQRGADHKVRMPSAFGTSRTMNGQRDDVGRSSKTLGGSIDFFVFH